MRAFLCAVAAIVPFALPAAASAANLQHPCSFRYGVGDYQEVSYEGQTACSEARVLIMLGTREGRQHPRVRVRTVRLPHSTWRCVTIRRREIHGEIISSHQI